MHTHRVASKVNACCFSFYSKQRLQQSVVKSRITHVRTNVRTNPFLQQSPTQSRCLQSIWLPIWRKWWVHGYISAWSRESFWVSDWSCSTAAYIRDGCRLTLPVICLTMRWAQSLKIFWNKWDEERFGTNNISSEIITRWEWVSE